MKHRLAQIMAVAALAAGALLAQGPPPPGPGGPPGDPQQREQRRLDMLATSLGLTDVQKAQTKTIFDASHQDAASLGQQLRQGQQALDDAAKTGQSAAEIDTLANSQGTVIGQLIAIQVKAFAQFYAILTPEQRQKADTLPGPWRGMMGGLGGAGFGPGRRP